MKRSTHIKYRLIVFIIVTQLVIVFSSCTQKKIIYESGDAISIFKKAKAQNKKVFILVTDSLCGNCSSFQDFLNTQTETVDILTKEYICYKADIQKISERKIIELLKVPSYPFPYFFDRKGNLEAFGFPNSKDFIITDLNKISVGEKFFGEFFRLPIDTKAYKRLVSLTLKTVVLMSSKDSISASKVLKKSLKVALYPFNVSLLNELSKFRIEGLDSILYKAMAYKQSPSDKVLYGDVNGYMKIPKKLRDTFTPQKISVDYNFLPREKDLGTLEIGNAYPFSFQIVNNSTIPLLINEVSHPCDCIHLKWPKGEIQQNKLATIEGVFRPYQSGHFNKEIFVHSNSINQTIGVFKISGIVQ